MDEANMGGVVCEDPLALETPEEICMEMRWNIETFLPPPVQKEFSNLVRFFIIEMHKTKQKSNNASRVPLRILHNNDMPDTTQRDVGKSKEMEATREFLARRLTRKLLKSIGSIQEKHREAMMDEEVLAEWEFPILPGSYLTLTNPVLELVKSVCAVLSLAKEYHVEIGLVKRSLLELVGVREFANDAVFHNPCEPLKLTSVPCQHCDGIRDFDFCRDVELMPNNIDINVKWLCTRCGGEYDRTGIELTLMEMVHELERRVTQQDLRCSKCKQLQGDNISRHCQCSGSYQLTMSISDVRRRLRTIVNVAIVHHLGRLKVRSSLTGFCTEFYTYDRNPLRPF
jgi:DNA polymerase epsilon subunit 1